MYRKSAWVILRVVFEARLKNPDFTKNITKSKPFLFLCFFIRFACIDYDMKNEISRKIGKRTFFAARSSESFTYLCPGRLVTSFVVVT